MYPSPLSPVGSIITRAFVMEFGLSITDTLLEAFHFDPGSSCSIEWAPRCDKNTESHAEIAYHRTCNSNRRQSGQRQMSCLRPALPTAPCCYIAALTTGDHQLTMLLITAACWSRVFDPHGFSDIDISRMYYALETIPYRFFGVTWLWSNLLGPVHRPHLNNSTAQSCCRNVSDFLRNC